MQETRKKDRARLAWIDPLIQMTGEFPTILLAIGVVANFAWLAVVFWLLSYWLVWRWA